jgi:hypothetical protein
MVTPALGEAADPRYEARYSRPAAIREHFATLSEKEMSTLRAIAN